MLFYFSFYFWPIAYRTHQVVQSSGSTADINRAGLRDEVVENVDIVDFAICDPYERWDVTPQVQKRVQLYSALCFPESSPWEDR